MGSTFINTFLDFLFKSLYAFGTFLGTPGVAPKEATWEIIGRLLVHVRETLAWNIARIPSGYLRDVLGMSASSRDLNHTRSSDMDFGIDFRGHTVHSLLKDTDTGVAYNASSFL